MRNQAHRGQQRERRRRFQQRRHINRQRRIHRKQKPSLGESFSVLPPQAPEPIRIARAQDAQDVIRIAEAAYGLKVIGDAPDGGEAQCRIAAKADAWGGHDARHGCGQARGQNLILLRWLWRGQILQASAAGQAPQ